MGNRLSKIVTRTGDDGTTGLADGSRVSKDSLRVIAMGDVDVLSNGNILAAFGALLPLEQAGEMDWWNRGRFPQWTMVREYTHTDPASLVWELRLLPRNRESGTGWTIFGAERFEYP